MACSNSCVVSADIGLIDLARDTVVVVCAGLGLREAASRPVLSWLRTQSRRGVRMGAVCTGAYILAKAGMTSQSLEMPTGSSADAEPEPAPSA